jgi:hypothetical protein
MSIIRITSRIFKERALSKPGLTLFIAACLLLFTAALFWLAFVKGMAVYAFAAVTSFPLFLAFIRYPRFWIYSLFFSLFAFLLTSAEGFSAIDLFFALVINFNLYLWIAWQAFVKRKRIVWNWGDGLIMTFFMLLPLNAIVAYLNGTPLGDWLRENFAFFDMPFLLADKRVFQRSRISKEIADIVVFYGLNVRYLRFYAYYEATKNIDYAFQLGRTVRINLSYLTIAGISGLAIVLLGNDKKLSLLIIAPTLASFGALILTMARSFWVELIFGVLFLQFYLSMKNRIKLFLMVAISSIALIMISISFFGDNYTLLMKLFEKKFESMSEGTSDVSAQSRLVEWSAIWEKIKQSPLGGNGMYATVSFYNSLDESTANTTVVHNMYLGLSLRLGIPMTVLLLIILLYFTLKAFKLSIITKDGFLKSVAFTAFFTGFVILTVNTLSFQILMRDGVFTVAFLISFTQIVERNYLERPEIRSKNKIFEKWRKLIK